MSEFAFNAIDLPEERRPLEETLRERGWAVSEPIRRPEQLDAVIEASRAAKELRIQTIARRANLHISPPVTTSAELGAYLAWVESDFHDQSDLGIQIT